jgi:hypothetical protein
MMIIVYIVVGRRVAKTRCWKAYCWTQAALIPLVGIGRMSVVLLFQHWVFASYFAIGLAPSILIIVLIACVVDDWRNGANRHWSHWVAAGAKLTGLGMHVAAIVMVGSVAGIC